MITITKNGKSLALKQFFFPAGEVGVSIDTKDLRYQLDAASYQTITARIQRSDDFMALALAKDALSHFDETPVRLFLPYIPYARQDRVCSSGDSFSLRVFTELVSSLGFEKITVVDPHSDVAVALLPRNTMVIRQFDVINRNQPFIERVLKGATFVSPDAGANKKTSELAKYFGHTSFIRADKLRNLATGEIIETVVYAEDLKGQDVVIADDICDGGRTFTELAKALKAKGAGKVILYVTHGIFTKGTKVLFDNGIDEIFTTNSYYDVWPAGVDGVTTLNLEKEFSL